MASPTLPVNWRKFAALFSLFALAWTCTLVVMHIEGRQLTSVGAGVATGFGVLWGLMSMLVSIRRR